MKHHTVTVTRRTSAPPEAVWELLADSTTWPDWSPVREMTIERSARDGGDGVGAIRSLKTALATSREQILEMDPHERFRYRMLSGLPLTDYVGTVTAAPGADGNTTITWSSTFSSPAGLRGWFWGRFINAAVTSYCQGLAAGAAKHAMRGSTGDGAPTRIAERPERRRATEAT